MATWTNDELNKIGSAEELQLASLRDNGTLSNPVTIWVVPLGNDLYVRAVNGPNGSWYRGTQSRCAGRIWANGVEKDVNFVEETNPEINNQIDAAYRAKYGHYAPQYFDPILAPKARSATLKLVPRSPSS